MKRNIYLILIALLIVVSAVFAIAKFHNPKTITVENSSTPKTSTNSEVPPLNFINQSASEIKGDRQNPTENPPVAVAEKKPAGKTAKLPVPNKPVIATQSLVPPICLGADASKFQCYEDFYMNLVTTKGIPAAFNDIKIRENENSYVKSQCHPLSHSIGHAAAGLFPDVLDAFANGDSFCWSGYYHGILEEIVDKMGKENTLANLNNICSRIPGKEEYSFDYYNCVHGLGHGLMGIAGQNLFDALSMCSNLSGDWEQSSCYSGVFMENVIIDNKGGKSDYLRPSEPVYPCNAVGDKYKEVCYLMQTSYMLKVSGNSFSRVFDLCAGVESPYQETCYQSLGRDASGQSSSNVEKTVATCGLGRDFTQKSNCVIGAVKDFISYYHSDMQAKAFCDSLTPDLQNVCRPTAENYYKSF